MNFWAATAFAADPRFAAATSGSKSGGSSYSFLILLALLAAGFYVLVLRPQRNRARKAQQQQREIAVGTKVMTASGMYGTVAAVEDDAILLEVAPGVTTRWARAAVGRVVETPEVLGLDEDNGGGGSPAEREHPDD